MCVGLLDTLGSVLASQQRQLPFARVAVINHEGSTTRPIGPIDRSQRSCGCTAGMLDGG